MSSYNQSPLAGEIAAVAALIAQCGEDLTLNSLTGTTITAIRETDKQRLQSYQLDTNPDSNAVTVFYVGSDDYTTYLTNAIGWNVFDQDGVKYLIDRVVLNRDGRTVQMATLVTERKHRANT